MEARSFSPDKSRTLLQKVKEFKADHAALKADAKKVVRANLRTTIASHHNLLLSGVSKVFLELRYIIKVV